jgi:hypothetical protein
MPRMGRCGDGRKWFKLFNRLAARWFYPDGASYPGRGNRALPLSLGLAGRRRWLRFDADAVHKHPTLCSRG